MCISATHKFDKCGRTGSNFLAPKGSAKKNLCVRRFSSFFAASLLFCVDAKNDVYRRPSTSSTSSMSSSSSSSSLSTSSTSSMSSSSFFSQVLSRKAHFKYLGGNVGQERALLTRSIVVTLY